MSMEKDALTSIMQELSLVREALGRVEKVLGGQQRASVRTGLLPDMFSACPRCYQLFYTGAHHVCANPEDER